MNAIEKIEFLEQVGLELQSRMTYDEIDNYFSAHGIDSRDRTPSVNSKRVYVKEILSGESEDLILQIADELEIPHSFSNHTAKQAAFWKSCYFRLFLSHLATFKVQTSHLQSVLKKYAISAFVAHEDIEPTRQWQDEIELGLHTMDALAAILMDGFKEINWCDQEIGVAVGRNILIIPVRKGLDPYGFIGKYQGIQANNKTVGDVAELIFKTIVSSPKTRNKMLTALSNSISQATNISEASEKVVILESVENVPHDLLENLKVQVTENSVLIKSKKFISSFNSMLNSFNVQSVTTGHKPESINWDDLPF